MKGLILFFVSLLGIYAQAETPQLPKLFFEYSWLYDSMCSKAPGKEIDPAWAEEAKAKAPEFAKAWEQKGPLLYQKVFETFGVGFERKEVTATLSVCRSPSYSHPLVLNVTRYLKSFMGDKPVYPEDHFVDLVFHELLHNWLVGQKLAGTPLLKKYQSEDQGVRSHMHLMAIQVMVYKQLQRPDLLQMIENYYLNELPANYQRAWKIVNEIEGFEAFIQELKK